MNDFMPLDHFEAVYLVDLCKPLLDVARRRLAQFPNVYVVKADATTLKLDVDQIDVISMSYSLSMIPPYFKVIDRLFDILKPAGLIAVVDFFTSNKETSDAEPNRQGSLFNRIFWKTWFEFDHVDLSPARRDYLEHKFEVIKSVSCRNNFAIPYIVSIPYYIYLGQRQPQVSQDVASISSSVVDLKQPTNSYDMPMTPEQTPIMVHKKHSMQDELPQLDLPEPQIKPNTKKNHDLKWTSHRLPYDPMNPEQSQFSDFIYSFVWEDPDEDILQMKINASDDMLIITSAGDNALNYVVNASPASIHCVDMNPCQGHLLELKIAAFKRLSYEEVWALFGAGKHTDFPALLDQLAPDLSAPAYQFWSMHENSFETCFYKSGFAGNVVKLLEWLFFFTGTRGAAKDMINATNLPQQRAAWQKLRKAFISNTVGTFILANPVFLWRALGVPMNQLKMLKNEGTALQYAIDTLDPIAHGTLLSASNFHYLLPILQHYTPKSCPAYLKPENYELMSADAGSALDALTLHTDTINNVLSGMAPDSLSKAIVMDHQDWFAEIKEGAVFPQPDSYLDAEIALFQKVLKHGGQVWWRSAAKVPWYAKRWELAGFKVTCVSSRENRKLLDKVNMYASLWVAKKV